MSSQKNHFDNQAKNWDKNEQYVARNRAVASGIRAMIPRLKGMRALDWGAGTGLLTAELIDDLGRVVAIDVSDGMLASLREKLGSRPSLTIRRHDLGQYDLEEEPFDLIYSAMTLHHVEHIGIILNRCYRLLQQGGYLAIADLEEEDGSFHGNSQIYYHAGFTPSSLAHAFEQVGFRDVRSRRVFTMKKAVKGEQRSYPVFLMVARKG